jgi:hypothetical protein
MWIVDSNPAFCGIAEPVGQYFYMRERYLGRRGRKEEQGQTYTVQVQSVPNSQYAEREGKETSKGQR